MTDRHTHCKIRICYIPITTTFHFSFPPRHSASDAIQNILCIRPRRLSLPKEACRQDTSKNQEYYRVLNSLPWLVIIFFKTPIVAYDTNERISHFICWLCVEWHLCLPFAEIVRQTTNVLVAGNDPSKSMPTWRQQTRGTACGCREGIISDVTLLDLLD